MEIWKYFVMSAAPTLAGPSGSKWSIDWVTGPLAGSIASGTLATLSQSQVLAWVNVACLALAAIGGAIYKGWGVINKQAIQNWKNWDEAQKASFETTANQAVARAAAMEAQVQQLARQLEQERGRNERLMDQLGEQAKNISEQSIQIATLTRQVAELTRVQHATSQAQRELPGQVADAVARTAQASSDSIPVMPHDPPTNPA